MHGYFDAPGVLCREFACYHLQLVANVAMFHTFTFALGVALEGGSMKSMKFMKRGVSG